jgi:hypothetical protein
MPPNDGETIESKDKSKRFLLSDIKAVLVKWNEHQEALKHDAESAKPIFDAWISERRQIVKIIFEVCFFITPICIYELITSTAGRRETTIRLEARTFSISRAKRF